jgi:hypothetical protein
MPPHGFVVDVVDVGDVVDVVDVVEVVVLCGGLVDGGGEVTDAGGGGLVDVGGGAVEVDVGGGVVEVVDEPTCRGANVVGEIVVQVRVGTTVVDGGASLETGAGIVGGGAGAGALVVGGEVTWRTRWVGLDDMMPTSVPATVAPTTIVIRPTAIPTRGRSIVRERATRSPRERAGEGPVTSSIVGGLARVGCRGRGSFPLSSAKNTKDGFVAPSTAVGGDAPVSAASTAASWVAGAGVAGAAGGSTQPGDAAGADPVSELRRRLGSERSTSMACSWCSTDRRSARLDDQVTCDSTMAATSKAMTRKKMLTPRPPLHPETRSPAWREIPARARSLY